MLQGRKLKRCRNAMGVTKWPTATFGKKGIHAGHGGTQGLREIAERCCENGAEKGNGEAGVNVKEGKGRQSEQENGLRPEGNREKGVDCSKSA